MPDYKMDIRGKLGLGEYSDIYDYMGIVDIILMSISGVSIALLVPVGVVMKLPSGRRAEMLPSLAATKPSCHSLWPTSHIASLISCSVMC